MSRRRAALVLLPLLGACTGEGRDDTALTALGCGDPAQTEVAVLTSLTFARRADDGTTPGFDLDGADDACGQPDQVAPDGRTSIDSSLSALVPALEATEAAAVEGLVQASINSGELLLLVEHSRIDEPVDDSCVDLGVWRGEGDAMVGTDGLLLDGQTFHRSSTISPVLLPEVEMAAGQVRTGPFEMNLPLQVLDAKLDFLLMDSWIEVNRHDDDTISGVIAGGVHIDQLIEIAARDDVGIADIVEPLVQLAADMNPDATGQCTTISTVFEFEGVPAFFFEDGPQGDGTAR